jgi:hypothetical protein
MAIPFASLRFPGGEEQAWKMNFTRSQPRESNYQYSWSANDRDEQCGPCQWGTVSGLTGVQPGRGLEILPSIIANRSDVRDATHLKNGDINQAMSLGAK